MIDAILKHRLPMKDNRRYWRNKIPKGASVLQVDRDLLGIGLENHSRVNDEIKKTWGSIDNFLRRGVGFCYHMVIVATGTQE